MVVCIFNHFRYDEMVQVLETGRQWSRKVGEIPDQGKSGNFDIDPGKFQFGEKDSGIFIGHML